MKGHETTILLMLTWLLAVTATFALVAAHNSFVQRHELPRGDWRAGAIVRLTAGGVVMVGLLGGLTLLLIAQHGP